MLGRSFLLTISFTGALFLSGCKESYDPFPPPKRFSPTVSEQTVLGVPKPEAVVVQIQQAELPPCQPGEADPAFASPCKPLTNLYPSSVQGDSEAVTPPVQAAGSPQSFKLSTD
jgi:hypothetical protein